MAGDNLTVNGVRVGAEGKSAAEARTIALPSGAVATVRKGCGRDLMRAQRVTEGGDATAVVFALIAELAEIDGRRIAFEDVLAMELGDVIALQGEVVGENFQFPPQGPSPDSSDSDFGSES
jgi:hypothetical protein